MSDPKQNGVFRDERGRLLPGSRLPGAGRPYSFAKQLQKRFGDDLEKLADVWADIIFGRPIPGNIIDPDWDDPPEVVKQYAERVLDPSRWGELQVMPTIAPVHVRAELAKLAAQHVVGLPKQSVDVTSNGETISPTQVNVAVALDASSGDELDALLSLVTRAKEKTIEAERVDAPAELEPAK